MHAHGETSNLPERALIERFEIPGPRYTSYPTADRFVEDFGADEYRLWLGKRGLGGASAGGPVSLYVHLPFCESVCYYCACNKIVTRHHERAARYLDYLERETDLVCEALSGSRRVEQLHFGGGTPTFLSIAELARLMDMLHARFDWSDDGEYSIEVDPRTVRPAAMRALRDLGLNRISLGVQDFDARVQRAVNRVQSVADTAAIVEAARVAGFRSTNIDLIYGLPHQSRASFAVTLDHVLAMAPDRIALYHYAHLPERFKPQRRIHATDLPDAEEKLGILCDAIERLAAAGYRHIGMDHFALPDDELARAQRDGRLRRNFQGYTVHSDGDLIGLGVSSIGKIGPTYAQNARELDDYYDALDQGRLPVVRGIVLDADDLARRAVIMALMCQYTVSKEAIASSCMIDFDAYFHDELARLGEFVEAGLVESNSEWITVNPRGRFLVRAIAMVFDRYLSRHAANRRYSKIV